VPPEKQGIREFLGAMIEVGEMEYGPQGEPSPIIVGHANAA